MQKNNTNGNLPVALPQIHEDWLALFAMWLTRIGVERSERTVVEYQRHVEGALAYLGSPGELSKGKLADYRTAIVAITKHPTTPKSASYANINLSALRSFLRFVLDRQDRNLQFLDEYLNFDVVKRQLKGVTDRKVSRRQVLSDVERRKLLAVATAPRDHLLLRFVLATGLREAEVCDVTLGDFRFDEDDNLWCLVRHGKGDKQREVPVHRAVAKELKSYLTSISLAIGRDADRSRYLFESRTKNGKAEAGGRCSTSRMRQIIRRYVTAAGITGKHISFHCLRHTAAVNMLRAERERAGGEMSNGLLQVSEILGHASISTTQIYVKHFEQKGLATFVNAMEI